MKDQRYTKLVLLYFSTAFSTLQYSTTTFRSVFQVHPTFLILEFRFNQWADHIGTDWYIISTVLIVKSCLTMRIRLEMFTHREQTHMCDSCACTCEKLFFLTHNVAQEGACTIHVSRMGSISYFGYFRRIFSNFTNFLMSSVLLQVCDNCTTIMRERATDFKIVRVRVRENFFVREHL